MNLIAAVDKNWGIGKNNSLLVSIPTDQKTFREMTIGNVVVMGRKTMESLPGGRPLDMRKNIVLTTSRSFQPKGVTVVHSLEELFRELEGETREVFVIGGGSVYRQLLPYCDTAHLTKIDHSYEADTFFPNLDEMEDWQVTAEGEELTYFDLEYTFVKYERK